jgi:hypothetical protein
VAREESEIANARSHALARDVWTTAKRRESCGSVVSATLLVIAPSSSRGAPEIGSSGAAPGFARRLATYMVSGVRSSRGLRVSAPALVPNVVTIGLAICVELAGAAGCGRIDYRPIDGAMTELSDAAGLDAPGVDAPEPDATPNDGAPIDAAPDGAGPPACVEHGDWTVVRRLAELGTSADEYGPELADGGLAIYYDTGGTGGWRQIFVARRPTREDPFESPTEITELASTITSGYDPAVRDDELEIYFVRDQPLSRCLYRSTRADRALPWGAPVRLDAICADVASSGPALTADGLRLFYDESSKTIFESARSSLSETFSSGSTHPELMGSGTRDAWPTVTADALTIFFTSDRGGDSDIYTSARPDLSTPFGPPAPVASLATASGEGDPAISDDGLELVFASDRESPATIGWELYLATRSCVR